MQPDPAPSLVDSTFVAALVAAVVALATVWWNSRRDRQDRQRQLFAHAFEACVLYREFPFIVRRRNADDLTAERGRITSELNRLQARLDSGGALLRVEAPRVGAAHENLVRETRRIAGPHISRAWDEPPVAVDADVRTEGIDYGELKPLEDAYLAEVRDHLSFWPRWVSAKWHGRNK